MGRQVCGSKSLDAVEDCICNMLPKPSLITANRIEKLTGIDHNIASACLETFAPHLGEAGLFELCEEMGQIRNLVRSAFNPNEYWIDDIDECVIEAIKSVDRLTYLSPHEREERAKVLVDACSIQSPVDKTCTNDFMDFRNYFPLIASCIGALYDIYRNPETGIAANYSAFELGRAVARIS